VDKNWYIGEEGRNRKQLGKFSPEEDDCKRKS